MIFIRNEKNFSMADQREERCLRFKDAFVLLTKVFFVDFHLALFSADGHLHQPV